MPVQNVFTSQIYQASCLTPSSPLMKDLIKEVSQIETADTGGAEWSAKNYPNGYTSYGSWDRLHLMSPHFQELKTKLDKHVANYLKILQWDVPRREIQLTRLWVNVMKENTIHTMHIHPLSVISGTFYLRTPAGGSGIKFEDPRFVNFMNRPPVKASARDKQSFVTLKPKPGQVILFESWMRHEVPLHTAKIPRLSVSFNYDWLS